MKKTYTFEIDQETAEKAERVFRGVGLSADLAIGMYFQRTALLGRLPYDPMAPIDDVASNPAAQPGPAEPACHAEQATHAHQDRQGYKTITRPMVERLWAVFKESLGSGRDANSMAAEVGTATGMNTGSAFIYLNILGNMVAGEPNTRNMKISDLAYYLERIHDELGEPSYSNARGSLMSSLAYWDEHSLGNFSDKVRSLLGSTESAMPDSASFAGRASSTLPIEFIPADRNEFKRLLLAHGNAVIHEHHSDGSVIDVPWRAAGMSETSNVIGNLRSMTNYRKGTWERLGIDRLVVEIR